MTVTPVILFVDTHRRALALQRDHDPEIMQVRCVGDRGAFRAHSIVIETPYSIRAGGATESQIAEFEDFMAWVPTRLAPGTLSRITRL